MNARIGDNGRPRAMRMDEVSRWKQEYTLLLQFVDVRHSSFVSANGPRVYREKDVVLNREKDTS
jgi:hypothetical protein